MVVPAFFPYQHRQDFRIRRRNSINSVLQFSQKQQLRVKENAF
jgi:hypothetical protein